MNWVWCIKFILGDSYLAASVTADTCYIMIYSLKNDTSGKAIKLLGHHETVRCIVEWDKATLISSGDDSQIIIWDISAIEKY
jgi:WD40 repeat protein